jgi:hypothetical protein
VKPRLFTLLAATSLLLCIATVTIWTRNCWYKDSIDYETAVGSKNQNSCGLTSYHTRIHVEFWRCYFAPQNRDHYIRVFSDGHTGSQLTWDVSRNEPMNEPTRKGMRWFQYWHTRDAYSAQNPNDPLYDTYHAIIPIPFLTALTLFLPILHLTQVSLRHARMKAGLCPNCNYDLRATPHCCPECGTVRAPIIS